MGPQSKLVPHWFLYLNQIPSMVGILQGNVGGMMSECEYLNYNCNSTAFRL